MQISTFSTIPIYTQQKSYGNLRKKHAILVGNPNRKKVHIFGFVGIFEYIC